MHFRALFLTLPLFTVLACDSPEVVDPLPGVAQAPEEALGADPRENADTPDQPDAEEADAWPYPWPSPADPLLLASQRLDEEIERIAGLDPGERGHLQAAALNLARRSLPNRTFIALSFDVNHQLAELDVSTLDAAQLEPFERDRLDALRELVGLQVEVLTALGFDPDVAIGEDEEAEIVEELIADLARSFPDSDATSLWQSEVAALHEAASASCGGCSEATITARASLDEALVAILDRAAELPDMGC